MTAWIADTAAEPARSSPTSTVVLEAAGGVIRTVLGLVQAQEVWVAVLADNPICQALLRKEKVQVIRADGHAFEADAHEDPSHAHAQNVLGALHTRLSALGAGSSAPARAFRLVLGTVRGPERGDTPRT